MRKRVFRDFQLKFAILIELTIYLLYLRMTNTFNTIRHIRHSLECYTSARIYSNHNNGLKLSA